jgi:replication-associated recombination protein RarA
MKALYEQYRPTSFAEVAGQDEVIRRIEILARRGLVGRVFWITSHSGQGKTTIGRLIAAQVANDHCTWEIDAQDLSLDTLRDWEKKCEGKPLVFGQDQRRAYAFIVNEAHTLSKRVVDRLKTTLELPHVQANSVWVFTTTIAEQAQRQLFDEAQTGGPFLSRAIELVLNHGPELELAFALRARQIAQAEQLNGQPLEAYVRLVRECGCNLRKVLQRIEAGEMLA